MWSLYGISFDIALLSLNFSWFERVTMIVILINCITLGMYKPCADSTTCNRKCLLLKVYLKSLWNLDILLPFLRLPITWYMYIFQLRWSSKWFVLIKFDTARDKICFQIALGVIGNGCYLMETWNKLDCFIVISGWYI